MFIRLATGPETIKIIINLSYVQIEASDWLPKMGLFNQSQCCILLHDGTMEKTPKTVR